MSQIILPTKVVKLMDWNKTPLDSPNPPFEKVRFYIDETFYTNQSKDAKYCMCGFILVYVQNDWRHGFFYHLKAMDFELIPDLSDYRMGYIEVSI